MLSPRSNQRRNRCFPLPLLQGSTPVTPPKTFNLALLFNGRFEVDNCNLKLPSIKPGEMAPASERTIDQIDAWIEENYKLFFDRKSYDEEKTRCSVEVQFKL